jgi:hypothetical protein
MRVHDETTPSECAVCSAGMCAASPEAAECRVCPSGTSRWSWAGSAAGQFCNTTITVTLHVVTWGEQISWDIDNKVSCHMTVWPKSLVIYYKLSVCHSVYVSSIVLYLY